ncbi:hypothetical protein C8Q72DRAFT_804513 [Fomitopsis betulina]|nr:hypothetical protein C8Q72DRAFT_804513 [Fomitopsis betulina]
MHYNTICTMTLANTLIPDTALSCCDSAFAGTTNVGGEPQVNSLQMSCAWAHHALAHSLPTLTFASCCTSTCRVHHHSLASVLFRIMKPMLTMIPTLALRIRSPGGCVDHPHSGTTLHPGIGQYMWVVNVHDARHWLHSHGQLIACNDEQGCKRMCA